MQQNKVLSRIPIIVIQDTPFYVDPAELGPDMRTGLVRDPSDYLKWAEAHGDLRASKLRPGCDPASAAEELLSGQVGATLAQEVFGGRLPETFKAHIRAQAVNALRGVGVDRIIDNERVNMDMGLGSDDAWNRILGWVRENGVYWDDAAGDYRAAR